ncbi:MAG: thioredoxin family protein [Ginsengibacter sp.]
MEKKIIISAMPVLFASFLLAFKLTADTLPIGSVLPKADVKMKDIKGSMISMKEATKKNGLLVMFSCNTCPYVIRNQQRTKAICKYALMNDIGVILINSNETQRDNVDSYEAMKNYANGQGYEWYYVVDKDNLVADEFGANRTPECFLFSKDLRLSYHGAIDDNPGDDENVNHHYLKEAINALLSGKEVSIKESRSVGCSIKRKG